jgi:hypothetical protein
MSTGIPGTGIATIFYVLSIVVMPVYELVRIARGRGTSLHRWLLIARHTALSTAMFATFYGTFTYLPRIQAGTLFIESQYTAIGITAGLLLAIVALLPRLRPLHSRVGA